MSASDFRLASTLGCILEGSGHLRIQLESKASSFIHARGQSGCLAGKWCTAPAKERIL